MPHVQANLWPIPGKHTMNDAELNLACVILDEGTRVLNLAARGNPEHPIVVRRVRDDQIQRSFRFRWP